MELVLPPLEATALESQGVRVLPQESPASPGRLPAICSLPRLFACMHANDATLFLAQFVYCTPVQGNAIGSVINSVAGRPQTVIHSPRSFSSHKQAIEGFLLSLTPPHLPPTSTLWGAFFMLPTISPLGIQMHFSDVYGTFEQRE